ncbi:29974_t:CDS:2, partial [Racocetra persica]
KAKEHEEAKQKKQKSNSKHESFSSIVIRLVQTFADFGIQVNLFEKACVDFESQVSFSDPMCEILQRRIDELEKNNKQLLSENETLKKKLSERFTNQEDRIHSIMRLPKKNE